MDVKGDKMQHIYIIVIMTFVIQFFSAASAQNRVHKSIRTVLHESFETPLDSSWLIYSDPSVDSSTFAGTYHAYGEGVDGSAGLKIEVFEPAEESWHVQLIVADWICEKDKLYRFSMRAKGENPVYFSVTEKPNFDYREGCTFNIYADTLDYYSYIFSSDTFGDGVLRLSISVGEKPGTYIFDEIIIEEVLHMDPENQWYSQADNRIEKYRKGDFQIDLSSEGGALSEKDLTIELVQHDFKFGTAVNFDTTVSDTAAYKEKILSNFNTIVTENALKWVDYEPEQGLIEVESFKEYINFADTNNLFLRGHVLAWGLQKNGFENHWSIEKDDPDFFAYHLKLRIQRDVATYKGLIDEYDVWNEPIHEKYIFNLCYDPTNYYWLMDSAFHWAHDIDPQVGLYINEYNVISGGRTETLFDFVSNMLKRNVPVTGIGVQCHFEEQGINPEVIRRRLDILAPLNLDIKITEFDMGTHEEGLMLTQKEMAVEYSKFMRTAFSHPAVSGLVLWGFTDDIIWVGPTDSGIGAGLYDPQGYPKVVKDSVDKLWKEEWHTELSERINSNGTLSFRGFYGTYRIHYTDPEERAEYECYVTLTKESPKAKAKLIKSGGTFIAGLKESSPETGIQLIPQRREIILKGFTEGSAKLLNLKGQTLIRTDISPSGAQKLSVSNLPSGVYLLKISTVGKSALQKIVL